MYPSNKSKEFPKILQLWWLWRISEEFLENSSCTWFLGNSREIPQNWSPRWEIFAESQFWDSVSRNSREILQNFSPQNSSECFPTKFLRISPEIPEKFLGLDHHVYRFLWEFIKRISFGKFLVISPEFHPKKILRI